jgi:hypothetical protein
LKKIDAGVLESGGYIQRNLNSGFTKTAKKLQCCFNFEKAVDLYVQIATLCIKQCKSVDVDLVGVTADFKNSGYLIRASKKRPKNAPKWTSRLKTVAI